MYKEVKLVESINNGACISQSVNLRVKVFHSFPFFRKGKKIKGENKKERKKKQNILSLLV